MDTAAEMPIEDLLQLNKTTKDMLLIMDTFDFDIFTIRKETKENELITTTTYLLHKHRIFQNLKISVEKYLTFISKIQSGYKDITYHNKTHGADVSCTAYLYLTKGEYLTKA